MMKYNTYIPKKFDLTELNSRIAEATCGIDPHVVLMEDSVRFLDVYDQYTSKGYKRNPAYPPLIMGHLLQLTLVKPKKLIDKEVECLAVEIEQQYRAEIKADQAESVKRMQARIIGEAQDKLIKQQAIEQASLEASAYAEALEILNLSEEEIAS